VELSASPQLNPSRIKQWMEDTKSSDVELSNWDVCDRAVDWFQEIHSYDLDRWTTASPKKIAIFAVYPAMITFYVALSAVLLRMGHYVDLVWLPGGQYDGSIEHGWESNLITNEMLALSNKVRHPKFRVQLLSEYSRKKISHSQKKYVEKQSVYDSQGALTTPHLDLGNTEHSRLYKFRKKKNLAAAEYLVSFLATSDHSHWIVDSGSWAEYGVVFPLLRENNIKSICIAFRPKKNTITISGNAPFTALSTDEAWEREEPHILTSNQRERIANWIKESETVEYSQRSSNLPFQIVPKMAVDEIRRHLKIGDTGHPVILLAANISWDSAVLAAETSTVFPDMMSWILRTIDFFSKRQDITLLIRPHPSEEIFNSRHTIAETIALEWPNLPPNVHLVGAQDINIYGLMEVATHGLVYMSDVGWEMALRGIPVINSAKAHYSDKGFAFSPGTEEEYFELLEKLAQNPAEVQMDSQMKDLAWCYADFFNNKLHKPFMWYPGMIIENMKQLPFADLLKPESLDEFSTALKILSGETNIYNGFIGDV
jgi:hypothetical protein